MHPIAHPPGGFWELDADNQDIILIGGPGERGAGGKGLQDDNQAADTSGFRLQTERKDEMYPKHLKRQRLWEGRKRTSR